MNDVLGLHCINFYIKISASLNVLFLNLLVKEIRRLGIAEDISAKSVSRFLKGRQISSGIR